MDRGRLAGRCKGCLWAHLRPLACTLPRYHPGLPEHLAPGTGPSQLPTSSSHSSHFLFPSSFSHLAQGSLSHRLVFFSLFGFLFPLSLVSSRSGFSGIIKIKDHSKNCIISIKRTGQANLPQPSQRIPIPTPHLAHCITQRNKTAKLLPLLTPTRTALRPFLPSPHQPPFLFSNLH